MSTKTKRDDNFYIGELTLIMENPLLPAGRKLEEVEKIMAGRRGTKGGNRTKELHGRQHYVDMINKRWASRSPKVTA